MLELNEVFSRDPAVRLATARAFEAARSQSVPPTLTDLPEPVHEAATRIHDLGDILGPLNAWLLLVGPSYGGPPPSMEVHNRIAGRQFPTLGRRHPNSTFNGRTHTRMRRWPTEAFARNDLFGGSEDDAWSVTALMNLSGSWAGKASDLAAEEVRHGLPKFWGAIEVMQPRVVLALDSISFKAIERSLRGHGARVEETQEHRVPGVTQTYRPTSMWVRIGGDQRFLVAKAPNHPAKMNFQLPEQTYNYLAMQVRRGLRAA